MERKSIALIGVWRSVVRLCAWLSGIGIGLLMLPTVLDVTYRKLIGPSLPGMVEVSEVGIVIVAYLAMAGALMHGSHISTPVFTNLLPARAAFGLRFAGKVAVWCVLALMVAATARVALESFAIREFRFGLVSMPIWPAKILVSLGLFLMLVELTVQMWLSLFMPHEKVVVDVD